MKQSNSNISIDLTEECNLACTYCFTWAKIHKKRILPRELGYKIVDHWLENGHSMGNMPRNMTFWGGEPLLEWKLLQDLVRYTNKKKGDQQVTFGGTCNGTLYTPDKVEWCLENKGLMLVSLDGVEAVHDYARKFRTGSGSWKVIDRNLRKALEIAPQQMVRASLTVQSTPYFLDTVKYFIEDLGVKDFSFSPVFEDPWDKENLELLEDQFKQVIDYMIKRRRNGDAVGVKHFDDEAKIPFNTKKLPPVPACGAGNNYSGWSIDGVNFPCHRFNKHELSTAERRKSPSVLGYIDDTGKFIDMKNPLRTTLLDFKNNPSDTCDSCDIFRKSICSGGCYALNNDFTKDVHGIVEKQCNFNKMQRRSGIYYAEQLKKAGLHLGPDMRPAKQESCTCYNMCYMENTAFEIMHINRNSDTACTCYNSSYSAQYENEQSRTIKEKRDKQQAVLNSLQNTLPKNEVVDRAFRVLKNETII